MFSPHFGRRKGRHLKISKDQRTCKQCSSQEIEDLKHFLINCNNYTTERRGLLDILKETCATRYNILSDDAKCFKLLNMEINPQFVDRCAAQIHLMYKKRKKAGNWTAEIFRYDFQITQFWLIFIVISCSFSYLSVFIRPHCGSAAFVIFL